MTQRTANFDPGFLRGLFDEMEATYGTVNMISSLGFTWRWRRQCLDKVTLSQDMLVCDLMTGMGELIPSIARRCFGQASVKAIDFSPNMCRRARQWIGKLGDLRVEILECDALENPIETGTVDAVVSTFGVKTLSVEQQRSLAREVHRLLRPGGVFSFLEVSVPAAWILRVPYLFYVDFVIPVIGRILLGNPVNYRYLGVFTKAFGNCREFAAILSEAGLSASYYSQFGGCATGVCGRKPV